MNNLKNLKVLVTGSSRGIGKVIAKKFLNAGSDVTIHGRNKKNLIKFCEENKINKFVCGDLSKKKIAKLVAKEFIKKNKKIDILVCNVGNGRSAKPGFETYIDWQKSFNDNFYSAINLIEELKRYLIKNKGKIICISSICGVQKIHGAPITYSVAKAALNHYIKTSSTYFGEKGVSINAIVPGNILFPGSNWDKKIKNSSMKIKKYISKNVDLNRFGKPEDIGNLCLYLASNETNFITGSLLVVDGGQLK
jgi:3-oxoacyl-[acyl-carrier protein] reductase